MIRLQLSVISRQTRKTLAQYSSVRGGRKDTFHDEGSNVSCRTLYSRKYRPRRLQWQCNTGTGGELDGTMDKRGRGTR